MQFRLDYALSREQSNKRGGKMYIQDKVEEYADEVFDLLDKGAHIYFCGLKGMMPGTAWSFSTASCFVYVGLISQLRVYCHVARLSPQW